MDLHTEDEKKGCILCPRRCTAKRSAGETGFCGQTDMPKIARAALHHWEEPCISGQKGSGTVFFSGCNLHCSFCQNQNISHNGFGKTVSSDSLCRIFFELKEKGAHNINLVTPSHFAPAVRDAIWTAREKGLDLPFICNCGGYESLEALQILNGWVDIYLTDLKFFHPARSKYYCGTEDYFSVASAALKEMLRQTGKIKLDKKGLLKKGVIVRHLMIPGELFDTKHILDYLCEQYRNQVYISLMNQYTPPRIPVNNAPDHPLRADHYDRMVRYLIDQGQTLAYIQEEGSCSESFIPDFDLTGVMGNKT